MLRGTDNNRKTIPHIQSECEAYSKNITWNIVTPA